MRSGPVLREPWFRRLPLHLVPLLSVTIRYSLKETAEIADDIVAQ